MFLCNYKFRHLVPLNIVKFYGLVGDYHLQIDSSLRGQVLGAIGFPPRESSLSRVKDASGLMSLILLLLRLIEVSLVKDCSGLMSLI